MIRRIAPAALALAAVATLLAWPHPSSANPKAPDTPPPYQVRFFGETGHSAVNWYLESWKNTPNALFVYGYPISQPFVEESFTNPGEFYRVQYFERAVLEEHPENFGQQGNKYYVLGRLMGKELAKGREGEPAFQPVGNPGDGTWDDATSHTLRNGPAPFRNFWLNNGGLSVFGRPLSEQFQEVNSQDGQTYWVQYFERQRMEWHPNEPNPEFRILLGLLGNEYRDKFHGNEDAFKSRGADDALPRDFVYGYNAFLYGDGTGWQDRNRVLQVSKNSGINWIRQQVAWRDLQDQSGAIYWNELDRIVDDCAKANVKLLLSVLRSPSWATADGSSGMPSAQYLPLFASFMGQMAARYQGRVQAYEIWNEQNLAVENGGRVANANYYVDLLAASYDAIKAADAMAIVVSGGPSSTETNRSDIAISDTEFARQMFTNQKFRTHVDAIGVHPGGQINSPDQMWPDNPGPGPWRDSREFYFRRIEDIRQMAVQNGMADKQLWVTEFGWATANNTPGYEYGNSISFDTQSQYIIRAFQRNRHDYAPWIGAAFLWQLNFAVPWKANGNEQHEQASFGVLNGDWSPRPAWYAIQAMPKN